MWSIHRVWGCVQYSTHWYSPTAANVGLLVQRPHILSLCTLMKVVNRRYMKPDITVWNTGHTWGEGLLYSLTTSLIQTSLQSVSWKSPHCLIVLIVFCYILWTLSVWCNLFSSFRVLFVMLTVAFNAISIYATAWSRLHFTFCVTPILHVNPYIPLSALSV